MAHRAIFLGMFDPAIAAAMRGWLSAGNEIAGFWYRTPRNRGSIDRDARLALLAPRWSVGAVARSNGVDIREIPGLSRWPERGEALRTAGADLLISLYFPELVPGDMLAMFDGRAVNMHPGSLPRHRGPTPLQAMVLDRSILSEGAMTLHVMSERFDEGPVIAREPVAFPPDHAFARYALGLAAAAGRLAAEALPAWLGGALAARPQDKANAAYPRVRAADLAISPRLAAADVRLRSDFLGRQWPLPVVGLPGVAVAGWRGEIGPPTGEPPEVGRFAIGMDVADRRVRLARRRPWSRTFRRIADLAIQVTTPG